MTEPGGGRKAGQARPGTGDGVQRACPLRQPLLRGLYGFAWRLARPLLARHKRLREGFSWRLVPEGWSCLPAGTQAGRAEKPAAKGKSHGQVDVWIQAASGGEAYLAWELLRHLAAASDAEAPLRILVTTWTRQGLEVLHGMAENLRRERPNLAIRVTLFPLDEPRLMDRALDQAKPRVIALLETEVWPGLLLAAAKRAVPVLILNGRMTEKSLRNYGLLERLCPGFWKSVAPRAVLGISEADAGRFAALFGDEKCEVAPNIKFDRCLPAEAAPPRPEIAALLPGLGPRLLLASTREEEEEPLLASIRLLRKQPASGPAPCVIVAPRHMHRVNAWQERLKGLGQDRLLLRSQLTPESPAPVGSTILWDAFGELAALYAAADAVFVGGSLAPLGGQNFLEALALGKRPCCGPYLDNFAWALDGRQGTEKDSLTRLGLLQICRTPHELAAALLKQAQMPAHGELGPTQVMERFQAWLAPRLGGSARCAEAIRACLPPAP